MDCSLWLNDTIANVNWDRGFVILRDLTVLVTGYLTLRVTWTSIKLYLFAQILPGVDFKSLGDWVVVTGATDGIGYAYSREFSRKGMNIVLISRTQEKLNKVKAELEEAHQIRVLTIQADFSQTGVYNHISQELNGLDIAVLINNVGIAQPTKGKYLDMPDLFSFVPKIVNTNCLSMSLMAAIVLPKMLEKRKGVIVNVSSSLVEYGFPSACIYSSTKSFASHFSDMLQRTYKNSGVMIQTLAPGPVSTSLAAGFNKKQLRKTLFICVDPETYVRTALNTIGWSNYCHGHIIHYWLTVFSTLLPVFLTDFFTDML